MKSKLLVRNDAATYALVLDTNDEVVESLTAFANEQALGGAHFTGIGALRSAVLGYFDWQKKDYKRIPMEQQVEVVSLIGDIALANGKPMVHAHIVLGRADGTAYAGHLLEGRVRPTLEVVLTESPAPLRRTHDEASGLLLIDLSA